MLHLLGITWPPCPSSETIMVICVKFRYCQQCQEATVGLGICPPLTRGRLLGLQALNWQRRGSMGNKSWGRCSNKTEPFLRLWVFQVHFTHCGRQSAVSIYSLSFSLSSHYFLGFTILQDIKSATDLKHPDRPSRLIRAKPCVSPHSLSSLVKVSLTSSHFKVLDGTQEPWVSLEEDLTATTTREVQEPGVDTKHRAQTACCPDEHRIQVVLDSKNPVFWESCPPAQGS